jgi:hypothetical protein
VIAPHWSVRRSIVSFSARTPRPRGMGRPGVLAVYGTPETPVPEPVFAMEVANPTDVPEQLGGPTRQ